MHGLVTTCANAISSWWSPEWARGKHVIVIISFSFWVFKASISFTHAMCNLSFSSAKKRETRKVVEVLKRRKLESDKRKPFMIAYGVIMCGAGRKVVFIVHLVLVIRILKCHKVILKPAWLLRHISEKVPAITLLTIIIVKKFFTNFYDLERDEFDFRCAAREKEDERKQLLAIKS